MLVQRRPGPMPLMASRLRPPTKRLASTHLPPDNNWLMTSWPISAAAAEIERLPRPPEDHPLPSPGRKASLYVVRRSLAVAIALLYGIVAVMAPAFARTPQEVLELIDRAMTHIHDVGREQAFADFTHPDGGFVDGELYVFCLDIGGMVLAHGGNPKLVGRNMADVRGPDGKRGNLESTRLGISQGSGWLEYQWPNPATKRIEPKTVYVQKVDDSTVCGSGYYKSSAPMQGGRTLSVITGHANVPGWPAVVFSVASTHGAAQTAAQAQVKLSASRQGYKRPAA
jgi:cytochrome c